MSKVDYLMVAVWASDMSDLYERHVIDASLARAGTTRWERRGLALIDAALVRVLSEAPRGLVKPRGAAFREMERR